MITRNFKLCLNAGVSQAPTINVNQYDRDEQWVFTLYNENGAVYVPSTGSIIGLKSDGHVIVNAGTVSDGKVVITETEQMTASAGNGVFELQIDGETHGTANFIVRVEKSPAEGGTESVTDISLLEQAIEAGGQFQSVTGDIATLKTTKADKTDLKNYIGCLRTLPNGTDLNSVRNVGIYLIAGTNTYTNAPTRFGILEILNAVGTSSTSIVMQKITNTDTIYFRYYGGSSWYNWRKVVGTDTGA